jgi:hypothetical protein
MRFTIFELLGWITFLAMLCALLSRASRDEAMVTVVWFVATILALKFIGPRAALMVSLAFSAIVGVCAAYWTLPLFVTSLALAVVIICSLFIFGWIIWGIVRLADTLITSLANRSRNLN